ncbi:tetrathionate reductase subunit A precursor [bacterium BMS3Abin02]|nr:tetrathionate reductase subunit A precursor [bacterium BMS3Abin02]GBE22324.1 tetrathionate reductase subunit A precursor [bacterium BMS3Bbin01]HDH24892.1 twin-arginine translocation signal domain-containing protein [Actinomycetota bacterium]
MADERQADTQQSDSTLSVTRRDFVKTSALVGGSIAMAGSLPALARITGNIVEPTAAAASVAYPLNNPENLIYSVCLSCHTACTLKAKLQDGVLVKVDGNPYSPMNLLPALWENTALPEAAKDDAKLCPKGQSSVQIAYDPYRVRKVLKRVGQRGQGQWQAIEWDQFIDEVTSGGDLFGEGPVDGLQDVYKLRDPGLAKELAADTSSVVAGDMTVDEFKKKHAAHLDLLIDPDHPDLGPVNNQFVFLGGRVEHGRKELSKRFTYDGMGSVNYYLHTTICEQSHHIAFKQMTGGKDHLKPDLLSAEFVIFFGTGAFEANFGPTPMAEQVTDSLIRNKFKFAVVDPRLSKTAAKAWKWVPVNPGADGALALGMIRWIIESGRYDSAYLSAPSMDAAKTNGEVTYSDATHLVRIDDMVFLTAEDAGLEPPTDKNGEPVAGARVVMTDGGPALADAAPAGVLQGEFTVNGIAVKPAFQLLTDRANERTLAEYADICGIRERDIADLADEFTSHGKRAATDMYRGPVQHTNGYHNGQAIITLNVLIGNVNHRGGLTAGGGHWHEDGSKPGAPFPKSVVAAAPGGLKKWGIHINRQQATYDKTTLFDGFPAKRPWYPFTNDVYQHVIPSAAAGYPYTAKVVLTNMGTVVLSSPAGQAQIDLLRDPAKIPLFIACDIVVGETSMYADYIVPDLTYMERWGTPHTSPTILTKMSKVRQPTMAPLTEIIEVDGERMPISFDAFLIAVGKKLGLAGFGKDGLGSGYPLDRPEQYFLAFFANLAFGDKEDGSETLPEADSEEFRIFRQARRHLPKTVFDEDVWMRAVPAKLWPSVVYLLNRGGRFEPSDKLYKDTEWLTHQWNGRWNLFIENVSKVKDSMTGKRFDGLPKWQPVKDAAGNEIDDGAFDLALITFKEIWEGQSRSRGSAWLQKAVSPRNHIQMNTRDAAARGLKSGDRARIVSASLPTGAFDLRDGRTYAVEAEVDVMEGMRPGTIALSWRGHWAYGSNDVVIDGLTIKGDPARASGTVPNPAMRIDPVVGDVCLTDPIGGSASFYDTKVRVEKV